MERENRPNITFNRRARRQRARTDLQLRESAWHAKRLNSDIALANQAVNIWGETVASSSKNFAEIAYRGKPFIDNFLTASRQIHADLGDVAGCGFFNSEQQASIAAIQDFDIFNRQVKGTSLEDIESMPLPLNLTDIKRINGIMRTQLSKKGFSPGAQVAESIIFFAVQSVTGRPDIPKSSSHIIKDLQVRVCDYFDYYTELMTDFGIEDWDELRFMMSLRLNQPYLPAALGGYIPGRLGITPSSAIKLYDERVDAFKSNLGLGIWPEKAWVKLFADIKRNTREAYRENNFPEALREYQHYNEATDVRASAHLNNTYGQQKLRNDDHIQLLDSNSQLLETLNARRKEILKCIKDKENYNSLYKFKTAGAAFKSVTLSSQNRDVLVFVLHFQDLQKTHLTVEIDSQGNIYGFPNRLLKDRPFVAELAIRDILLPVIGDIEGKRDSKSAKVTMVFPIAVRNLQHNEQRLAEPVEDKPQEKRVRPRIMTPLVEYFLYPRDEPASRDRAPSQIRKVMYSREIIEELLAGQKRDEKYVNKIIAAINRFEHGAKDPKMIDWSGGKAIVLRVGDTRIVLRHQGNSRYTLDAVGDRENVYRNFADKKV